jgi:hypothetical protein
MRKKYQQRRYIFLRENQKYTENHLTSKTYNQQLTSATKVCNQQLTAAKIHNQQLTSATKVCNQQLTANIGSQNS